MSSSIYSLPGQAISTTSAPAGPVVQRKCASCESAPAGVGSQCPACAAEDKLAPASIQTKLTISSPGDAYEREADEVADQVMASSESTPRITPMLQRQPMEEEEEELQPKRVGPDSPVQRQEVPEEEEEMQMKAAPGGPAPAAGIAPRLAASASAGQPLPSPARTFFEGRFGRSFDHVRVHDGAEAAAMNQSIRARAFTHGSHVYFGAGSYAPDSEWGRRLLAHELTHVVQQTSAPAVADPSRKRGKA